MPDRENVIKGLEEAEIMLIQAVDRGGKMAVMGAFKCLNRVTDALALLKEQPQIVRCNDCKYCSSEIRDGIKFAKCELKHNWMPQPGWFCADGERQEGR